MSLLIRYFERLLKKGRHDRAVEDLTYVTCYDCGERFFAHTEYEAALALSKHSILTHDSPPDWEAEAQAVDEEIGFRSEIHDLWYGAR